MRLSVFVFITAECASAALITMGGDGDIKRWFESQGYGKVKKGSSLGGSGWSSTSRWSTEDAKSFFVKTSSRKYEKMFRGEAEGLRAMYGLSESLRIPKVLHGGDYEDGRGSFIVMEYMEIRGRGDQKELGRAMGQLHSVEFPQFGFDVDNTIGATPQPNTWSDTWIDFYRDYRLKHQLNLAGDSSLDRLAQDLLPRLSEFFSDDEVIKPSLIHGDLWSGNIGSTPEGPTIFDPACYYAHHEAEWGMSWCASFSPAFWEGYREIIPESPGFKKRRPLYELYHQLNHYNLFGGGYRNAAAGCMEQALRSLE